MERIAHGMLWGQHSSEGELGYRGNCIRLSASQSSSKNELAYDGLSDLGISAAFSIWASGF